MEAVSHVGHSSHNSSANYCPSGFWNASPLPLSLSSLLPSSSFSVPSFSLSLPFSLPFPSWPRPPILNGGERDHKGMGYCRYTQVKVRIDHTFTHGRTNIISALGMELIKISRDGINFVLPANLTFACTPVVRSIAWMRMFTDAWIAYRLYHLRTDGKAY